MALNNAEKKVLGSILVWLPSPMGDAIMSTAALRSIREFFPDVRIYFFASETVRQILSPCRFNDEWIISHSSSPFVIARELEDYGFSMAILFKNSFASALAVRLASIPRRIGYCRDFRKFFLTDRLIPAKLPSGEYKPVPAIDYYLTIAAWIGGDVMNSQTELEIGQRDIEFVRERFADSVQSSRPLVFFVPGGAFGPSKCWPGENFAETADYLIEKYDADIFISVAPVQAEMQVASKICDLVKQKDKVINLGQAHLNLGQLKALFSFSSLVITNDTGPRHLAIALGRKVISMFGPNDPAWTDNDYPDETKVVSAADCAPCNRPRCTKKKHICMESITPEMICAAADEMLGVK